MICQGCDRPDTHLASPPDPEQRTRTDAAFEVISTVLVDFADPGLQTEEPGEYSLLIEDLTSSQQVVLPLGDRSDSWPRTTELPSGLFGRYRVTAFLDRTENGQFDDCPFPGGPFDPETADKRDNIQVSRDIVLPDPNPIVLDITRRICGPGSETTGISGKFDGLTDTLKIYLLAERQSVAADPLNQGGDVVLRTPLSLNVDEDGSRSFSVGELLPGRYDLTVFTDEDGDLTPSPCEQSPGGGDLFVAKIQGVEIVSGTRRVLETITYVPGDCVEPLTGISGTIDVGDGVLDGSDQVGPLDLSVGAVRVRLISVDGNAEPILKKIQPRLSGRPMPLKYTVTGIPPGLWSPTVFLDRDDDGVFKACDAVPVGFDAVAGVVDEVEVVEGTIADAGHVQLIARACGMNARSGVRATASVEAEMGPIGSGRPIRMAVEPIALEGEALDVVVFQNHQELLGSPTSFTQELAAGRYRGRLFLDTDRNGFLSECGEDGYGDRQVTEDFEFELQTGALLALGNIALEGVGCRIPDTDITIRLNHPVQLPLSPPPEISIRIDETGGWTSTMQEFPIINNNEWLIGPLPLVPGKFTFTVYTDDDRNGEFSSCGSLGGDQYGATFFVELDSINPSATMEIGLETLCP